MKTGKLSKKDYDDFLAFIEFKKGFNEKKEVKLSKHGKKIGRPKGTTKKRKGMYKDNYELFISKLLVDDEITNGRKEWTQKVVYLLFYGGFRINEVVGLKCQDICDIVEKGELNLANNTKTKQSRDVFFSLKSRENIKELFKEEILYCGEKYVVHGRHGSYDKASVGNITNQLNELLKKYLNGQYTTHSFRQAVVTDTIRKHGLKEAQLFIGHASEATTLKYQEILEEELKAVAENIR